MKEKNHRDLPPKHLILNFQEHKRDQGVGGMRSGAGWEERCDTLVIEVLAPSVDLILQGEVEGHVLDALPGEHLGAGCIVHSLEMADHVRKPNSQSIVAEEAKVGCHETALREQDQAEQKQGSPMESAPFWASLPSSLRSHTPPCL